MQTFLRSASPRLRTAHRYLRPHRRRPQGPLSGQCCSLRPPALYLSPLPLGHRSCRSRRRHGSRPEFPPLLHQHLPHAPPKCSCRCGGSSYSHHPTIGHVSLIQPPAGWQWGKRQALPALGDGSRSLLSAPSSTLHNSVFSLHACTQTQTHTHTHTAPVTLLRAKGRCHPGPGSQPWHCPRCRHWRGHRRPAPPGRCAEGTWRQWLSEASPLHWHVDVPQDIHRH